MREVEMGVQTADGIMDTFICHPEEGGPFPAVIMSMDAPGIREELRDMARRIGSVGYFVLLPNLYYRSGREGGIEIYPDTEHGFAFPQRPAYNKGAAERHWERMFALFDRRLRV